MWSIYDTCILLSGVITSVIAVLPLRGIPIRTRAIAGLVGGGLIVVSLVLGKLSAFRYPAIVLIGPLIALSALGAVVWDERRDRGKDAGRQYDETASGADPEAPHPVVATPPLEDGHLASSAQEPGMMHVAAPVANAAGIEAERARVDAWAAAHDPATLSERLAEVVERYPEFATAIAAHPNCYPELMAWMLDANLVPEASSSNAINPVPEPSVIETTMAVASTVSAPQGEVRVNQEPSSTMSAQQASEGAAYLDARVGRSEKIPRRRWVIPTLGAVGALLVLGVAFLLISRVTPNAASVQSSTYPSAVGSSVVNSPSHNSEPTSASPDSDEVLSYICWNGDEVSALQSCSQPTGKAGLKYIYPSMNDQWSHCKYADLRPTTATYECTFADGIIRYRYWKDSVEADQHYRDKYVSGDSSDFILDDTNVGTLYRSTERDKNGKFNLTARWGNGHYALSVDSTTRAGQDALWKTVRFRSLSDLRGHLSQNDPGDAERA